MEKHELSNKTVEMYWEKQNSLFEEIEKAGGIGEYIKNVEHIEDAFVPKNRNLCCIDERITKGTIRYAGCGILDQKNALSEEMVEELKEAGVDGVWSHKGCGVASMAFDKLSDKEKARLGSAETYAQEWAKKLADALNVPYLGHLEVEPNFHNARVIYYDGTGKFDPSRSEKFPRGFVISRRWLKRDYAKNELNLALSIALGGHGFGRDRFLNKSPLLIVPIGNPRDERFSLEALKQEIKECIGEYKNTAIIDGFTAPVI